MFLPSSHIPSSCVSRVARVDQDLSIQTYDLNEKTESCARPWMNEISPEPCFWLFSFRKLVLLWSSEWILSVQQMFTCAWTLTATLFALQFISLIGRTCRTKGSTVDSFFMKCKILMHRIFISPYDLNILPSWVWQCRSVIPAPRRQRQENQELKSSSGAQWAQWQPEINETMSHESKNQMISEMAQCLLPQVVQFPGPTFMRK